MPRRHQRPVARSRRPEKKQNDGNAMKNKFNTQSVTAKSNPQYALRKIGDNWELTFEGSTTRRKDEAGWKYVHHLLFNPPDEPIFGYHLAAKVAEPDATGTALTEI